MAADAWSRIRAGAGYRRFDAPTGRAAIRARRHDFRVTTETVAK